MPSKSLEELEGMVGCSKETVRGMTIEAGKVEEFARAIEDDNPAHRSREAAKAQGFDEVPAVLTFTRTFAFPRYQPRSLEGIRGFDLGFERGQTVHGEQEYTFERPVLVGDTLSGESTLTGVYQRESSSGNCLTFAVVETVFRDEEGQVVVTERSTYLEVGDDE